jgi:hypothetical protein
METLAAAAQVAGAGVAHFGASGKVAGRRRDHDANTLLKRRRRLRRPWLDSGQNLVGMAR